jgi:hypothetical protein
MKWRYYRSTVSIYFHAALLPNLHGRHATGFKGVITFDVTEMSSFFGICH